MSLFQKRIKKDMSKVIDQVNQVDEEPIMLYVPFEYKEQAKKLGAQFNRAYLKWYTVRSNPNSQQLIDMFHEDNFRTSYYGERFKFELSTEISRDLSKRLKKAHYTEKFEQYKADVILEKGKWTHQNEKNFNEWYTINFEQ